MIAVLVLCLSACDPGGKDQFEDAVDAALTAYEVTSGEVQDVTEAKQNDLTGIADTTNFVPLKKYTDPAELCADYLEEYVTSVFTGSDFDINKYSSDSKLVEYTSQKYEFERRYHAKGGFGALNDLKIHTDEIFLSDTSEGVLWLKVPYEVSYGSSSAYGNIAYFEASENEEGFYELSMALDYGYGDSYLLSTQIHRKGISPPLDIDLDSGIEYARKSNEWNDVIQSEIDAMWSEAVSKVK